MKGIWQRFSLPLVLFFMLMLTDAKRKPSLVFIFKPWTSSRSLNRKKTPKDMAHMDGKEALGFYPGNLAGVEESGQRQGHCRRAMRGTLPWGH